MKIATSFGGAPLSANLVLEVLKDGGWRRHLASTRERLARSMAETVRRLAGIGIRPVIEPDGGMFLWCRLPAGLDAADIARKALAEDVILAPGNVFSLTQSAGDCLRFNVAQSADPRIFAVLDRAMRD